MTRLIGEEDYVNGQYMDDDLKFNSDYSIKDVDDLGMNIRNITLEKGDMIQTKNQKEKNDEGIFLGVLPNNTLYISWAVYFRKKLFVDEDDVVCVKKVDKKHTIYQHWQRENGNEDFVLVTDRL